MRKDREFGLTGILTLIVFTILIPGNVAGDLWIEHKTLTIDSYDVTSLVISPDGSWLISGSDRELNIWNASDWTFNQTIPAHDSWIETLDFNSDSSLLASGSHDFTIQIWDTTTWANITNLNHSSYVRSLDFSPDDSFLA